MREERSIVDDVTGGVEAVGTADKEEFGMGLGVGKMKGKIPGNLVKMPLNVP